MSLPTAQLSADRLAELLGKFANCRLAVVGDYFVDKYLLVDPALALVSRETGKVAHQVPEVRSSPGAAGTVMSNLSALGGGTLHAVGYCGDDGEGYDLRKGLTALGCQIDHLHVTEDRNTPTYLKPRDAGVRGLAAEHSRYDTVNATPTPAALEDKIIASLEALLPELDGVIVLDQIEQAERGVVTARVRERLAELAAEYPHVPFFADSRQNISRFRRHIIKPNQFEAVGGDTGPDTADIDFPALQAAGDAMQAESGAPLIITCGPRGAIVSSPEWTWAPGVPVEGETDPTGAGDSWTSGCMLSLCSGATLPEAAVVGNLVASITVQQLDTCGTASPDQLPPRLVDWHAANG